MGKKIKNNHGLQTKPIHTGHVVIPVIGVIMQPICSFKFRWLMALYLILPIQIYANNYEEGIAAFNSGQDAKAFEILKPLADSGDPKSQNMVGFLFVMGYGVDSSNKQATRYYQMAAEQGYADAQYNLARQYLNGSGVEKSTANAIKWFEKAAALGIEDATKKLKELQPTTIPKGFSLYKSKGSSKENKTLTQAEIIEIVHKGYLAYNSGDYSKSFEIWSKAAQAGDAVAQTNLSIQYSYGVGTELSKDKALFWLNKALAQNYSNAYQFTATLHLKGLFYPKSKSKAFEYYQEAANLGDLKSIYALGEINETWGNLDAAFKKYKKAAELGYPEAQAMMGLIYEGNSSAFKKEKFIPVDLEKSMHWFLKSAKNGFHYAIYTVGYNYKTGRGVEKSLVKAHYWFKQCARMGGQECVMSMSKEEQLAFKKESFQMAQKLAKNGDSKAQYALAQAYKYGDGVNKSESQARSWLIKSAAQNHPDAMLELAEIYAHNNDNRSDDLYKKLASKTMKSRAVVTRAINAYVNGNYKLTFTLAKPYADIGNKYAQNIMGKLYNFGRGVAKSKQQSMNYLKKAATATQDISLQEIEAEAQYNLGFLYQYSYNDPQQAASWYSKATQVEHVDALMALALLYSSGEGVIQDQNKTIALYARAEAAGDEIAKAYKQTAQSELRIEKEQLRKSQLRVKRAERARTKKSTKIAVEQNRQDKAKQAYITSLPTFSYPKPKKKFWSWSSFLSGVVNQQNNSRTYALDDWKPKSLPGWQPNHLEVFKRKMNDRIEKVSGYRYKR